MRALLIVGPSGAGKSTLQNRLLHGDGLMRVVTNTTRVRKPSEFNGYDYNFISSREFKELKSSGAFIETTRHNGHSYGILKTEIDAAIELDLSPIMVVTPHAMGIFKDLYADKMDILTVFITAKKDELEMRLNDTKFNDTRDKKLANLDFEMDWVNRFKFDIIIYNNDIAKTISAINKELLKY